MKNSLIIIGAGGQGRVVADIASLAGYTNICFLDDANIRNDNRLGRVEDFIKYIDDSDFFVAIGNNIIRKRIHERLVEAHANIVTLIHPNATVSPSVKLGRGVVVMAGAVINTGCVIGDGVIVNTSSSVDHDCKIDDFVHVSVGSHLAGTISVGEGTFIGAGATIINNICICKNSMVGAGAVVVENINIAGTYIGVPAKLKSF